MDNQTAHILTTPKETFEGFKGVSVLITVDFTDHDERDPPTYLAKASITESVKTLLRNSHINVVPNEEEIKSGEKKYEEPTIALHTAVTFAQARASSKMIVTAYSIKVDAHMVVIRTLDLESTDGYRELDAVVWQSYFMGLTSSNNIGLEHEIKAIIERRIQNFITAYSSSE